MRKFSTIFCIILLFLCLVSCNEGAKLGSIYLSVPGITESRLATDETTSNDVAIYKINITGEKQKFSYEGYLAPGSSISFMDVEADSYKIDCNAFDNNNLCIGYGYERIEVFPEQLTKAIIKMNYTNITLNKLQNETISINKEGSLTKTNYAHNEAFNVEGLKYFVNFENGYVAELKYLDSSENPELIANSGAKGYFSTEPDAGDLLTSENTKCKVYLIFDNEKYLLESFDISVAEPEPETYTVTFKDGDSVLSTITGVIGTEITAPAVTEEPGYTSSWDKDVAKSITENATYTVVWTPITYTITYELDGGTNATSNPATYTIESDTITFAEPTKDGYIFVAWNPTSIEKGSTGDKTVTATWEEIAEPEPETYTVTFKDGDTVLLTITGVTGTEITAPVTEKPGYTSSWDEEVASTITGDATYTVVWTPINYTITYELDGGTNTESNPTTYTIESDTITFAEPTKEGYTFVAWIDSDNTTITQIEKGSIGDITVTATWEEIAEPEPETYTVTFKDGDEILSTITGVTGTEITAPPVTEKPGYTSSWDQEVASTITGDATYTVVWTPITYTITYELDGGTNATSNPTSYTIESTITFAEPTKEGYTFVAWTDSTDNIITQIEKGSTGDITVTATWEVIPEPEYTVTFKNGDTVISTITGVTGTEITAPPVTEKPGYTSSWDEEVASTITGDATYTAVWTPITYTITYELNGGTNATSNPTSYTIESNTITFAEPTKEGYTFVAWIDSANTTITQIEKGSIGDKTVTATWEEIAEPEPETYTVTISVTLPTYTEAGILTWDNETKTLTFTPNDNSNSYTYAWYKDGENIKNATAATYVLSEADLDAGYYTFMIVITDDNDNLYSSSCEISISKTKETSEE